MTQYVRSASPELLSTREVADEIGVSYRMLDYWCRGSRVLAPTVEAHGSGSARGFTAEDVERLRKAACLVRALGGGGEGGNTIAVEFVERFVVDAIEVVGGWCWAAPDFSLTVRCT